MSRTCFICRSKFTFSKFEGKYIVYCCYDCGKSFGREKRKDPFNTNRVEALPLLEFIEKYPDFTQRSRYQTFLEMGFDCVGCDIKGTHVVWWKEWNGADHYDIAGLDENGKLIMITIDHIYPKSKGGPNHIINYQPMCAPCNRIKSDNIQT